MTTIKQGGSGLTEQDSAGPDKRRAQGAATVPWTVALPALAVAIAALIWIHWDTAWTMYDRWSNIHSYNHAFLILPICAYLAWERRDALRLFQPRPSFVGVLFVFGAGAAWLVGDAVDVSATRQAALVGMIEALVFAMLGWRACRVLLFPLAYAWLVVPLDLGLLPVLQTMATAASSWLISLLGIPLFVEGNYIELTSGRYWVAPGCAGLNFLLSGFALALLYAEQMYDSWKKRIACVVVMILVAIVANWLRIFALIGAGHFLGEVYDINDHYMEGWLFFAVVVFIMMWIGLRFRDPAPQGAAEAAPAHVTPTRPAALVLFAAVAVVGVAGGAIYPAYSVYLRSALPPVPPMHVAFPPSIGDWRLLDRAGNWKPAFRGADAQATGRYVKGAETVDLYVAYYARQDSGREVVTYANRVFDNEVWRLQRRGTARTQIGTTPVVVTESVLRSAVNRRLVWHLYWIDGRFTRSQTEAKLLQAKANLLYGDRRAGFVAVSGTSMENPAALDAFLRALPPVSDLVAPGATGG